MLLPKRYPVFLASALLNGCIGSPFGQTLDEAEVKDMVYGNTLVYQWPTGVESRSYTSPNGKTYYYTGNGSWKGAFNLELDGLRQFCYNYTQPVELQHCGYFTRSSDGLVASRAIPNDKAIKAAKTTKYKDVNKYMQNVSKLLYPGDNATVSIIKGDSLGTVNVVNNDIKASRSKEIMGILLSDEVVGAAFSAYSAAMVAGVVQAFKPAKLPQHCTKEAGFDSSLSISVNRGWVIPRSAKKFAVSIEGESCFYKEIKEGERSILSDEVRFVALPQDTYKIRIGGYDDVNNEVFESKGTYEHRGDGDIYCYVNVQKNYINCRKI